MDSRASAVVVCLVLCCAWQIRAQSVNCTSAGRFADLTDTTCQNYTLCVYNSSSGNYLSYYYHCPTTSVFNPNSRQCTASTNYACNGTTTASDTPVSICSTEGFIADPSTDGCRSYIECVADGGTFIETTYFCPDGSLFDPATSDCAFDYACPTAFTCTAAGRFADPADTTCESYYFCVLRPDGSYVSSKKTCPSPALFNPVSKICSSSYACVV